MHKFQVILKRARRIISVEKIAERKSWKKNVEKKKTKVFQCANVHYKEDAKDEIGLICRQKDLGQMVGGGNA